MSNKKVLTFAALGVALVGLIKAAESNPELKKALEAFKIDFDDHGSSTIDLATVLADANSQIADLNTQIKGAPKDLTSELNEAIGVISDLKNQLEIALEAKEAKTVQLTVTVDKVKHVVNHGAHPYSAQEIADSPALAKEILKIKGQNAISKL